MILVAVCCFLAGVYSPGYSEELGLLGVSSIIPQNFTYTGAATYSVPIVVPPGRAKIAPNLALTYNSYVGNGWLGVGWTLDLGSIQRSLKNGVHYTADDFVAVTNGKSTELAARPDWGSGHFGAKIESDFTKFEKIADTQGTGFGFVATAADGTKYYFGRNASSRLDNTKGIFKWCLDRIQDTNGNYLTISYFKDLNEANLLRQIYPLEIKYTGNATKGLAPYYSIKFDLDGSVGGAQRGDSITSYISHSMESTTRRLTDIRIYAGADQVRKYHMEYDEDLEVDGAFTTGRSKLKTVQQYGTDFSSPLPPLSFGYQGGGVRFPSTLSTQPAEILQNFGSSGDFEDKAITAGDINGDGLTDLVICSEYNIYILLAKADGSYEKTSQSQSSDVNAIRSIRLADLNNDGLLDLVQKLASGSKVSYNMNNGNNGFGARNEVWAALTAESTESILIADFNGDGLYDIIYSSESSTPTAVYLKGQVTSAGAFTFIRATGPSFNPEFTGKLDEMLVGDINGDKCADFIMRSDYAAGGIYYIFFGNPKDGNQFYSREASGAGTSQIGTTTILADMNGDGLADIAKYNNKLTVYTSVGDGNFTAGVPYTMPAGAPFFADMNGDGLTDLVSVYRPRESENQQIIVSLSKDGATFYKPTWQTSYLTNMSVPSGGVFFPDANGDGLTDIIAFTATGRDIQKIYYPFLAKLGTGIIPPINPELKPEEKPDLLCHITNSLGASTSIAYKSSSWWSDNRMPFVLPTVYSITVKSLAGSTEGESFTTTYAYEGGLYDFKEREFRGFAKVFQRNPNGSYGRTDYYQDKYFQGRPKKVYTGRGASPISKYDVFIDDAPPGTVFSATTNTFGLQALNLGDPADPDDDINLVKLDDQASTSYESGTSITTTTHNTYVEKAGTGYWYLQSSKSSGPSADSVTTTNEYTKYSTWIWRPTKTTITDGANVKLRETVFRYASNNGNLLSKTFWGPGSPQISMTYDLYGNVKTITDAENNAPTRYVYDAKTQTFPITVTNSVGHVIENVEATLDYRFGTFGTVKDANGNQTSYRYDDPFGRPTQIDYPDGGQLLKDYDLCTNSLRTRVKQGAGYLTTIASADGLGRLIQSVSYDETGKAIVSRHYFDTRQGIATVQGPFSTSTALTWPLPCSTTSRPYLIPAPADSPFAKKEMNQRGRLVKTSSSSAPTPTTYSYTGLSSGHLQTTVTGPDGQRKSNNTDYLGRLRSVIEYNDAGAPVTTQYEYNAAGDLLKVINALNQSTTISYDTLGRKISMTDPDMGYWQYPEYDRNGNIKKQIDAMGQITTFGYDALSRVLWKDFSNEAPGRDTKMVAYTYDTSGIPNSKGQLCQVTNTDVTTTFNSFDVMGRVKSVTKTITGAPAYTTTFDYDNAGQLWRTTYPDGYQVENAYYQASGRLHTVSGVRANDSQSLMALSAYNPSGQIGTMQFGNGDITNYTYSTTSGYVNRLQTMETTRPAAASGTPYTDGFDTLLQKNDYTYQTSGNIDTIVESQPAGAITPGPGPAQMVKGFDATFPVHGVKNVTIDDKKYSYQYDGNGNMTAGPDFRNPASVSQRTVAYNAENMPTSLPASGVSIIYDGNGVRAKKTDGSGNVTYYIGDHFEIRNGQAVKYIFAGSKRIAMAVGNAPATHALYFFHSNHLGSNVAITDKDRRLVYKTGSFNPFGRLDTAWGDATLSAYKFTDQEYDAETGLYNFNARLYDPMIGGFISADTMVPNYADPQSLNRYAYALGNPLSYIDPTGNFSMDQFMVSFVSGVVGGVVFVCSGGTGAPVSAAIWGGMAAGATAGALSGGGVNAVLTGTVTGGMLGGIGGSLYAGFGTPALYGMAATGAGYAYSQNGLDGLAYFGAGVAGSMAGAYTANGLINNDTGGGPGKKFSKPENTRLLSREVSGVKINFGLDADNPVDSILADQLDQSLTMTKGDYPDFNSIEISATTNGPHTSPLSPHHFSKAVDINRINNLRVIIGYGNDFRFTQITNSLLTNMAKIGNYYDTLGPKFGMSNYYTPSSALIKTHNNHIHYSVP